MGMGEKNLTHCGDIGTDNGHQIQLTSPGNKGKYVMRRQTRILRTQQIKLQERVKEHGYVKVKVSVW